MIKKSLHVLFILVCAFHLGLGDGFKFVYSYESPNTMKLQVRYDNFRIDAYKFDTDVQFNQIQFSDNQQTHILIDQLAQCTLYHIEATIRDLHSNTHFQYKESILMIPPKTVLQTVPDLITIDIEMNFEYRQCFESVLVVVDNTSSILYTQGNLSSWLTIPGLSPCVTYNIQIYITHRSTQFIIYNQTITTISIIKYKNVQTINYDNGTDTLSWPNFLGDCSLKYLIIVTSVVSSTSVTHETTTNEYQLDFLDGCTAYNITVTSKNHSESNSNIFISIGHKEPGPITNLTVNMIDNTIWCRWDPPYINPACVSDYKVQINTNSLVTKGHEHSMFVTKPCQVYNISICQLIDRDEFYFQPKNCVNRTFDTSKFENIQNVSNIDAKTNYNRMLTTVSWNVSDIEESCIKHYELRLYENLVNEIFEEIVTSSIVEMPQLTACQQYRLEIKTIPKYNRLSKIESNFVFTTKSKTPDAPMDPKLLFKTASSLTLKTQYLNELDNCTIELFKISCTNNMYPIERIVYDEKGLATFNNLKSYTNYNCSATVKNELGWSVSSNFTLVFLDWQTADRINLYVNSISPRSITISCEISANNGNCTLAIIKVEPQEKFPKTCEFTNYTDKVELSNKNWKANFMNLEPNTNYSFQVISWIPRDGFQTLSDEMFVTTDPDVPFRVTNLEIMDLSSRSVTIAWRLPCVLNGQVKSFVGQVHEIDHLNSAELLYDWTVPFIDESRIFEIFHYTENRIKPQRKYIISVAIKIKNFEGHLNESKIEFTTLESDIKLDQPTAWATLIEKTSEYHELEINEFFHKRYNFTLLISEPECNIPRKSIANIKETSSLQCITECRFNETPNKVKIMLTAHNGSSCGITGQNSIELMKGMDYQIQARFGNITTPTLYYKSKLQDHTIITILHVAICAAILLIVFVVFVVVIYWRYWREHAYKIDGTSDNGSDISDFSDK